MRIAKIKYIKYRIKYNRYYFWHIIYSYIFRKMDRLFNEMKEISQSMEEDLKEV